jgi:Uma2 family endonuclease
MAILEREIRQEALGASALGRRLWTTAEYYKMVDAGILDLHERVELIDGEVIKLAPIGPEHWGSTNKVFRGLLTLSDVLGQQFAVMFERSVSFIDGTEPQPDVVVARGSMDDYWKRHPGPADLLLVVEVCASTLASDRKRKLPMYAGFAIPEVWIVNLVDRQVEVYRDPSGNHYATTLTYVPGDAIEISFASGKKIAVADVLPPVE